MHFSILCLVKSIDDVTRVMKPHEGELWDWFQIGGRWSGLFDGYEPEKDPRNIEPCELCDATGKRTDTVGTMCRESNPAYTCNGCDGKGRRVKWPTQWAWHAGDVIPIESIKDDVVSKFYAIVAPDRKLAWVCEKYCPDEKRPEDKFKPQEMPTLAYLREHYPDHLAVVVDCHN